MIDLWKKDDLYKHILAYMKKHFDEMFQGIKIGKFEPKANPDPYLHGYWGSTMATMTTQAIELGIPSLQF